MISRIIYFSLALVLLSCASNKVTFKQNVVTSQTGINEVQIRDLRGKLLASYKSDDSTMYVKFNLDDIDSLFEMKYNIAGFLFIEDSTYVFSFYPSYDRKSSLILKRSPSGIFIPKY